MENENNQQFDAIMTEYVMPKDTNALGILFGGQLFSWMDLCAGIAVKKHTGRSAVTAGVENLSFLTPAYSGDILTLKASVLSVGNTSVRLNVSVLREEHQTGNFTQIAKGIFIFVII